MRHATRQTVKKELSLSQKREQLLSLSICFLLLMGAYFLSIQPGVLSLCGYVIAIALLLLLCRCIQKHRFYYIYQLKEEYFLVRQTKGFQSPNELCKIPFSAMQSLLPSQDTSWKEDENTLTLYATASERNPLNQQLLFLQEGKRVRLLITPNPWIGSTLQTICQHNHTQRCPSQQTKGESS